MRPRVQSGRRSAARMCRTSEIQFIEINDSGQSAHTKQHTHRHQTHNAGTLAVGSDALDIYIYVQALYITAVYYI